MTSTIAPPQIASLLIIGPDEGDISTTENPAYTTATAELDRLASWPSATVRFVGGGTLHGSAVRVRDLLTRFGGAQ